MIPFTKYQGAGNDFILIDFPLEPSVALIKRLCDRKLGVGADGVLFICPSDIAEAKMRIFNADGSEPSMCGNGIRCAFDFTEAKTIEVSGRVYECWRENDTIFVKLGIPSILHAPIEIDHLVGYIIDTGVPHAVIVVDAVEAVSVIEWGRRVRHHSLFAPHGVNVNFVSFQEKGKIAVRTYERGVEDETLACGTGCAAAAYISHQYFDHPATVDVKTVSGELISYLMNGNEIQMMGKATKVFSGNFL